MKYIVRFTIIAALVSAFVFSSFAQDQMTKEEWQKRSVNVNSFAQFHEIKGLLRHATWEKGVKQESAAAIFVFGGRLCVYLPRGGTHLSNTLVYVVHDLELASYVIRRFYPNATDIRPQPGGYLLFPPKT